MIKARAVQESETPLTNRAEHVHPYELSAHGIALDARGLVLKLLQLLFQELFHAHALVLNFLSDGKPSSWEHFSFQFCQKQGIGI